MNKLDIHTFPLYGQSLIEASAGTGKTYTINQLYRRLTLGHGIDARLGCTDILVVTFTKAATEELRGRIRSGLRDAFENLLAGEAESNVMPDADVQRWVTSLQSEKGISRDELKTWLQLNLAQMDEAAIFTIHKFCAQMLKRYAFDSGVAFNLALEVEGEEYLRRACEDVWRQICYPQSRDVLEFMTSRFSGPDHLFSYFRSWMSKPSIRIKPDLDTAFDDLWTQFHQAFEDAKNLWFFLGSDNIVKTITSADIDKRSYTSKNLPNWMSQAGDYFAAGSALPLPANLYRFGSQMLAEKTKSGEPPRHKLFEKIDELTELNQSMTLSLELMWFKTIYGRYIELLEQAAVMTSDDLLRLLDAALNSDRGEELAAQIRRLYPVAMIDEFQDTDPVQYRIFSRIYPAEQEGESRHGLIMIGDPKQAIYAFRGADIFTYMQASKAIPPSRRFTLDTNYRSDSRLIQATNNLWQSHKAPFVFDDAIEFYPVNAGGQHDKKAPVWQAGIPDEALQLWISDEEDNKANSMQRVAEECAVQIASLLAGAAVYPAASRKSRSARRGKPVEAGDVAVLVYSRVQAKIIRQALTAQGIGSVFLTRDSVLDSTEAWDLLAMLEAIAHPGNEAAVRRAIATPTWGATANDLVRMQEEESLWEGQLAAMHAYHQIWQRRGVMAMLMQWLEDNERAVRLRKLDEGERVLTNILHLGEMLQAQSRKVRGHQALIRWFSERVDPASDRGEEAQLRLETDDRLVNIVTIHKSKGLEYPFVFLPYLWADSARPRQQSTETIYYNGREVVRDLAPDDNARARQRDDVLAEQMRLLYVALTRAKFGCYVWLANAVSGKNKKPVWPESALGYLLGGTELSDIQIPGMYAGPLPAWNVAGQAELDVPPPPVAPAVNQARWRDHWRVGSYSQLAAHSAHQAEAAAADLGHYFDWEAGLNSVVADTPEVLPLALRFPKGANPGTCLHAIFEHWDFQCQDSLADICETQLRLYGIQDQNPAEVADWITGVVAQPLALYDTSVALKDIQAGARLDEMEFYLPVGQLSAGDINTLMGGEARFSFEPLTGYLKGFIDLIFEWQGRFYVADYKSNHLGNEWQNYVPEALRESMREHRYDLQSWIYMLALDQLLSKRLPDYQPQKHLGGSVYLYLRGMGSHFTDGGEHPDPDAGVCFTPASPELLKRWRDLILPGKGVSA